MPEYTEAAQSITGGRLGFLRQGLSSIIVVMTKLSVNVNKIATLRNTRTNGSPTSSPRQDRPRRGADGITAPPPGPATHPAEDVRSSPPWIARYRGGVQHRG